MEYIIEIATTDYLTTAGAVAGGADRIELCAALSEGGITPSYGTIRQCREAFEVELFPIIRPRPGDFLYTKEEFAIMMHEVKLCRELGCDGVVIGMLHKDGSLDMDSIQRLVDAAYPMEVTFHRAFDRCLDPFQALEQLVSVGCNRILTSGQQLAAPQGVSLIADLVKAADERIVIMPGSGVRKENIRALAEETGAREFHSSLRGKQRSSMEFIHPFFAHSEESYSQPYIDPSEVKALRDSLRS